MNATNAPQGTNPPINYRHLVVRAVASRPNLPVQREGSALSRGSHAGQAEPSPNREPVSPLISSLAGVVRGVFAQFFFYPLDTVRIRQQAAEKPLSARAITASLMNEGAGAFYKGFGYKTVKTAVKQAACWPCITGLPPYFSHLGPVMQQLPTGLVVGLVDALVSKHLDGLQIRSIADGKTAGLKSFLKAGHGYPTYLAHVTVAWTASLVALKFFELRELKNGQTLTAFQTGKIGILAGLFSSFVSAPFDVANTVKQARGLSLGRFVKEQGFAALGRGFSLRTSVIVAQNVVSSFLLRELVPAGDSSTGS